MAKNQCLMIFEEILPVTKRMTDAQFGTLIRAVLAYRFHGEAYRGEDAAIDIAFQFMCSQVDRTEETRAQKSKAAHDRWNAKTMHTDADPVHSDAPIQSNPIQSNPIQSNPIQSDPIQSDPIQSQDKTEKESNPSAMGKCGKGAPAPARPRQSAYGKYSWVKLSREEYEALERILGAQELSRCIDYLDEAAQMTGNKNRWRDWGTVIRRCSREGWGRDAPGRGSRDIPKGASGVLGAAEMRNIQRAMEEDYAAPGN